MSAKKAVGTVQPSFVVTVAPRSMPGATAVEPPSQRQLDALGEAVTPEIADRLLDGHEEVTLTLCRANSAQAWVPIEAPAESEEEQ